MKGASPTARSDWNDGSSLFDRGGKFNCYVRLSSDLRRLGRSGCERLWDRA